MNWRDSLVRKLCPMNEGDMVVPQPPDLEDLGPLTGIVTEVQVDPLIDRCRFVVLWSDGIVRKNRPESVRRIVA